MVPGALLWPLCSKQAQLSQTTGSCCRFVALRNNKVKEKKIKEFYLPWLGSGDARSCCDIRSPSVQQTSFGFFQVKAGCSWVRESQIPVLRGLQTRAVFEKQRGQPTTDLSSFPLWKSEAALLFTLPLQTETGFFFFFCFLFCFLFFFSQSSFFPPFHIFPINFHSSHRRLLSRSR